MSASIEQIQVEAIRSLTKQIPLNDFGLPTGIYRTDLLPFHDYEPNTPSLVHTNGDKPVVDTKAIDSVNSKAIAVDYGPDTSYRIAGFPAKDLHNAFIPLQFDEGFPAFENGMSFWERLEFEPIDAFQAFQKYLQMNLGHAPIADTAEGEEYDGKAAGGTRSISELVTLDHPDSDILNIVSLYQRYYHLYYWGLRVRAYDLFRVAQFRIKQEFRAVETQADHYVQSQRLRHRLMQYINDEEEFWGLMTRKVAIDMMKTLTQLERISAGLPAAGPVSDKAEDHSGTPFEVILRTVANSHRTDTGTTVDEEGEILDRALESPEATEVLQEIIIRQGR